jgi:hypothetical protein
MSKWGCARLFSALAFAGAASCAQALDSYRCGGRLVGRDATMQAVLQLCGDPDLRDHPGYADPRFNPRAAQAEVWYYNPGPGGLIGILMFHAGRLYSIDTGGYGFHVNPDPHCEPEDIAEGLDKYTLLARCGEPRRKSAESLWVPWSEIASMHRYLPLSDPGPFVAVYRERWIYTFGAGVLPREVTLENGTVAGVTTTDPR